jgi:hypothetical protein
MILFSVSDQEILNKKYSWIIIPEYFCQYLEIFLESLHDVAQE